MKNMYMPVLAGVLVQFAVLPLHAELTFDGTLGDTALHAPQSGNMLITEGMGQRAGNNLFHSFGRFNVLSAESATFTGANSIANVVARVTGLGELNGATPSTIDGQLRVDIADASFWLVNPAGVLIGENATFDVAGTLGIGGADSVEFGAALVFDLGTTAGELSTLTVDPSGFGFMDNSTAQRVEWSNAAALNVVRSGGLSLANANISAGDAVSINVGELQLERSTVTAAPGAAINVFARDIELIDTLVQTDGGNVAAAGDISLGALESLTLADSGVSASTASGANAGNINLFGRNISIAGNFRSADPLGNTRTIGVESATTGAGNGGNVRIAATQALGTIALTRGADVKTTAGVEADPTGSAGPFGNAGNIDLFATDSISMVGVDTSDRSHLSTSSFAGAGQAGALNVQGASVTTDFAALTAVTASNTPIPFFGSRPNVVRVVASNRPPFSATGGRIDIKDTLLSASTNGVAHASGVGVSSLGGPITIRGASVLTADAGLDALDPLAPIGAAGGVEITTLSDVISITGTDAGTPVRLSASSSSAAGQPGRITLLSRSADIEFADIRSEGASTSDVGLLPIVTIDVDAGITLTNSLISLATSGQGLARGVIRFDAGEDIVLQNSGLNSSTSGAGPALAISIAGRSFSMTGNFAGTDSFGNARTIGIESSTTGTGNAGDILIGRVTNALVPLDGPISLNGGAVIRTTAGIRGVDGVAPGTYGNAGSINLLSADVISLNGIDAVTPIEVVSSSFSGAGSAGQVYMAASSLTSEHARVLVEQGPTVDQVSGGFILFDVVNGIELTDTLVSNFNRGLRPNFQGRVRISSGDAPGNTLQPAGALTMTRSGINASTAAEGGAGDILILVDSLSMNGNFASMGAGPIGIESTTIGAGPGGRVRIAGQFGLGGLTPMVGTVSLTGGARIRTSAGIEGGDASPGTYGNAGTIELLTLSDVDIAGSMANRALISSAAFLGAGNAGIVNVRGAKLQSAWGQISTNVVGDFSGEQSAGDIQLLFTGDVSLNDTYVLTTSQAAGTAGAITIEGSGVAIRGMIGGTDAATPALLRFADVNDLDDDGIVDDPFTTLVEEDSITSTSLILATFDNAGGNPGGPGTVEIRATGAIDLNDPPRGRVTVAGSVVSADNTGGRDFVTEDGAVNDGARGNVRLIAERLDISRSRISTDVTANGLGDDVQLFANEISISDRSLLSARTQLTAATSGSIRLAGRAEADGTMLAEAQRIELLDTTVTVENFSDGNGGNSLVTGGSIQMFGRSVLVGSASAVSATATLFGNDPFSGSNSAGAIFIIGGSADAGAVSEDGLVVIDGASVSSLANGRRVQRAGDIRVAGGTVVADAASISVSTTSDVRFALQTDERGFLSYDADGNALPLLAGDQPVLVAPAAIDVFASLPTAQRIAGFSSGATLLDGMIALGIALNAVDIAGSTAGAANAGGITLQGQRVALRGTRSGLSMSLVPLGGVEASTTGLGDAGNVAMSGTEIVLDQGARVAATTDAGGNAGSITLNGGASVSVNVGQPSADLVVIESASRVGDTGSAGSVTITTPRLDVTNATISAATQSSRAQNAPGTVLLDARGGRIDLASSGVQSSTSGTANAGSVTLLANEIALRDFATVTSGTLGAGDAGEVRLLASERIRGNYDVNGGRLFAAGTALISSQSTGQLDLNTGSAGSVLLSAPSIELFNTSVTTLITSTRDDVQGGTVLLDAGDGLIDLELTNVTSDTLGIASAGSVTLQADTIAMRDGTVVSSSTTGFGDAGSVLLQASGPISANLDDDGAALADARRIDVGTDSLAVNGGSGGDVRLLGADIRLANADVSASSMSDRAATRAGSVLLVAQGRVDLMQTFVTSDTFGAANAGTVTLQGEQILLRDFTLVSSSTVGAGNAGSVRLIGSDWVRANVDPVTAEPLDLNLVLVSSDSVGPEAGAAGDVILDAGSIDLAGAAVTVDTESNNTANRPGTILLNAPGSFVALTDTVVSSNTSGATAAGSVAIATDQLFMDGAQIAATTEDFGDAGAIVLAGSMQRATDGSLVLDANGRPQILTPLINLLIVNNGQIETSSSGFGAAGDLLIRASGAVEVNGGIRSEAGLFSDRAGSIDIAAGSLFLNEATVSTVTFSLNPNAAPAAISLNVGGRLDLLTSQIQSSTAGVSNAGSIDISASRMQASVLSLVSATSSGAGNGGSINIGSDVIVLDTFSSIGAQTGGAGNAGDISINTGVLVLADVFDIPGSSTSITADTFSTGNAGTIRINAGSIGVFDNAFIGSSSGFASGNAGDIEISANDLTIAGPSAEILGFSLVNGRAGNIRLNIAESITIDRVGVGGAPLAADDDRRPGISVLTTDCLVCDGTGSILLQTPQLTLNGGDISAGTRGNAPGGSIVAIADRVMLDDAGFSASTLGTGLGGTIMVDAAAIELNNDSTVTAAAFAAGNAGSIFLLSDAFTMNGGTVSASTRSTGNGGSVRIAGDVLADGTLVPISGPIMLSSGAVVSSETTAAGNAGSVSLLGSANVSLNNVQVRTRSQTSAGGNVPSLGNAGPVTIAGESLSAVGATISSTTASNDAAASPIDVLLDFSGAVALSGSVVESSTTAAANAGSIAVLGASLTVRGGRLSATTAGSGSAGSIMVAGDVARGADGGVLRGADGRPQIAAPLSGNVLVTDGARVESSSSAGGDAGGVLIAANGDVNVQRGVAAASGSGGVGIAALTAIDTALLSQSTAAANGGTAGSIGVTGRDITIQDAAVQVTTQSGGSGSIALAAANQLRVNSGSQITADTAGGFSGGNVSLSGVNGISVTGMGTQVSSSTTGQGANAGAGGNVVLQSTAGNVIVDAAAVSADTTSSGRGGSVGVLTPNDVTLTNGSQLSSSAAGSGAGGSVSIGTLGANTIALAPVRNFRIVNGSFVRTDAVQSNSGSINVAVSGELRVEDRSGIVASAGAAGQGGNVNISTGEGFVRKSAIQARADAGNGGAINIAVTGAQQRFIKDSESDISADSNTGSSGTVSISAPDTDLNAAIAPQDAELGRQPELSADACSPAAQRVQSTFVVQDQGGVRAAPEAYLGAGVSGRGQAAALAARATGGLPPVALASLTGDCP